MKITTKQEEKKQKVIKEMLRNLTNKNKKEKRKAFEKMKRNVVNRQSSLMME